MPRGRSFRNASLLSPSVHSQAIQRQAVRLACRPVLMQELENRRLLTTLSGDDPTYESTFTYADHDNNRIVINLSGHVTAEFIGVNSRPDGTTVVRDLVAHPGVIPQGFKGFDLFTIYISQADTTGRISISEIAANGIVQPYTDAPKQFLGGTMDGDMGLVYIGGRTPRTDTNDIAAPFMALPYRRAFGVRPATKVLYAGIQTAEGVDMGEVNIGGIVTGLVYMGGNVDTFYAGNISTGVIGDTFFLSNNFFIGGNIRHLDVLQNVGTFTYTDEAGDHIVSPGTDMRVSGRVGDVRIGGDFASDIEVINDPGVPAIDTQNQETEPQQVPGLFLTDGAISAPIFRNDTFDTAQILGTEHSNPLNVDNVVDLVGDLDDSTPAADSGDFYGLPLLAGQAINFKVIPVEDTTTLTPLTTLSPITWNLISPDGVIIDSSTVAWNPSNKNGVNPTTPNPRLNSQNVFTTTQPGVYRLQITSGGLGGSYRLIVDGMQTLALGGMQVAGTMSFPDTELGVYVRRGDLGALLNDTAFTNRGDNIDSPIRLDKGNLRALVAASIDLGANLAVPRGVVGLLQSTEGDIAGNTDAGAFATSFDVANAGTLAVLAYQSVIAHHGGISANLVSRQGIGTLRAIQGGTTLIDGQITPRVIVVNADQIGTDGIIDLMAADVSFGNAAGGGPGIFTGPGGNVRYLMAPAVYRDRFFGSSVVTTQTYLPGQTVTLSDDSGAVARITPSSYVDGTTFTQGQLTITTYGVRDKGGVVLANVTGTSGFDITSSGAAGTVEISQLLTSLSGTAVSVNATSGRITYGTNGNATLVNNVNLRGPLPINVYLLGGAAGLSPASATGTVAFTNVINSTEGEMANVLASSIGVLRARRLGYAAPQATPAALHGEELTGLPAENFSAATTTAIRVGNAIEISAREDLGNISAGSVGTLSANSDRVNNRHVFEGITGSVAGDWLQNVYIGEGILPSGAGTAARSGLFASGTYGRIGVVTGDTGAAIRGTVSADNYIDNITLLNGSIIGATIATTAGEAPNPTTVVTGQTIVTPRDNLGSINLKGNGGIIGSVLSFGRAGNITVEGFGIISSSLISSSLLDATRDLKVGGLGIRNSFIDFGTSIQSIAATNLTGKTLDLKAYDPNVLFSASRKVDPFTGYQINPITDLYRAIGLNRATSAQAGASTAGVLENSLILGNGSAKSISFYTIRSSHPDADINAVTYPMRISVVSNVDNITTTAGIYGLQLTTANLKAMSVGGDIRSTRISATNSIGTIGARAIRGSTSIRSTGPNGKITAITTRSTMAPFEIVASIAIGTISAGGAFATDPTSSYGLRAPTISNLIVGGDVITGTSVRATKVLSNLVIGGNVQAGASIIAKTFGTKTIKGTIFGTVAVG